MAFFSNAFFSETLSDMENLLADQLVNGRLYGVRNVTGASSQDPAWYMYFATTSLPTDSPNVVDAANGSGKFVYTNGSASSGGGGGSSLQTIIGGPPPGETAITPANGTGTIAIHLEDGSTYGLFPGEIYGSAFYRATGTGDFDWEAINAGQFVDYAGFDPTARGVSGTFRGQLYVSTWFDFGGSVSNMNIFAFDANDEWVNIFSNGPVNSGGGSIT